MYYPYGFSIASDGSFWIPQPNSQNIIHLDSNYNEIASYSTARHHARECVDRHRWQRLLHRTNGSVGTGIYQLIPTTPGAVNYFAYSPSAGPHLDRPRGLRHLER